MRFNKFFDELLFNEGGFSDDPDDSGGKTIYGISSRFFPETYKQIMDLFLQGKRDVAFQMAKKFYRKEFYNPLYNELKDYQLAFRIFDVGVNIGKKKAIKILQKCLGITADGIFGKMTLAKANEVNIYDTFVEKLEEYYKSLHQPKFEKGWLKRLHRLI